MTNGNHRKIAVAVWGNIISPVFDSSRTVLIADIENGKVAASRKEMLGPELPYSRALRLSEWGVQVLICGAISLDFARTLEIYGIEVIGFISGDANQVLDAYLKKNLFSNAFLMPGCRGGGRRRRFRGGRG